jgi:hypothetical protein
VAELARLQIHWPARWYTWGTLGWMVIEVDGREVGRLHHGKNLVINVDSALRNLRARMLKYRSVPLELVLASGEAARLETRFTKGVWITQLSLVRIDGGGAVSPVQSPVPSAAQVLGVTKTHRSEEPIGTETRRIDNTSSMSRGDSDHAGDQGVESRGQVGPELQSRCLCRRVGWSKLAGVAGSVEESLSHTLDRDCRCLPGWFQARAYRS